MIFSSSRSALGASFLWIVPAVLACSSAEDVGPGEVTVSGGASGLGASGGGTGAYEGSGSVSGSGAESGSRAGGAPGSDASDGGSGGVFGAGGTGLDATGGAPAAGGQNGAEMGATVCAQSGVLLCEDFESYPVDQPPAGPWTLAMVGTDGVARIDGQTQAQSGTNSLMISSLGNYQTFAAITGTPVFPAPSPALYARVYIRLSEAMTGGHNTYFKAGAAGAASSENETRVGVMNEMLMINQPDGDRGFLSNQNFWTDHLPGVVIEPNTWTCIEGYFDPPHSTVQFWVDETQISDLHVTDWKQDELGSFHFGFEAYAGPDTVVWYDDIVISTEPVGCGKLR